MPIAMTCGGCGQVLNAPVSATGKRARCPKCGSFARVPEPGWAPPTVEFRAVSDEGLPTTGREDVDISQHEALPAAGSAHPPAHRLLRNLAGAVVGLALAVGGSWWALRRAEMPRRPQDAARGPEAIVQEVPEAPLPPPAPPRAGAGGEEEPRKTRWIGSTIGSVHLEPRSGLTVSELTPPMDLGRKLAPGDRVVLVEVGGGGGAEECSDVVITSDLEAMRERFAPGLEHRAAEYQAGKEGRIFAVPEGTVAEVVDGKPARVGLDLKVVHIRLLPSGEEAWAYRPCLR